MRDCSSRFVCGESTGGKTQIMRTSISLFWKTRKRFKYCRVWAQEDNIHTQDVRLEKTERRSPSHVVVEMGF